MILSCLFAYVREKIRTPDTLVRSQVLYPAELRTHIQFIVSETRYNAGDRNRTGTVFLQQDLSPARLPVPPRRHNEINSSNGTYRARTYDPLLVRQMLSQLS